MNSDNQEAFWAQLSRVQPSATKPTPFNSSCGKLVPFYQQWRPPVVNNDKECKSDEENEIELKDSRGIVNEVKLKQGYQNSGCLSNMVCLFVQFLTGNNRMLFHKSYITQSTFIVTLLITPEIQDAIENNLFNKNINGDRPGEAIYIRSLLEMYNQLMNCYEPMHISMLLNAIRAHGQGNWRTIDMKSHYSLSDIVNLLMHEWHMDIADMKNDLVEEPSRRDIKEYMKYMHDQHGTSPLDDIFAIEMIHDHKCLKCGNHRRDFNICWQYSIPVTLHCFRYWTIDDEKTTTGTFMFMTPQQLLSHSKIQDVFSLIVAEEEQLDETDEIELHKQHYITINGTIKYCVFVSCLTKSDDMCAWTGHDWFSTVSTTVEYNQQFKYTLVFQTIPNPQQITNNHYYKVEQYHIVNKKIFFPKSYPQMDWIQQSNNVQLQPVQCHTYEIDKITSAHKQKIHAPQGDSVLALSEQLDFTIKHGYLQHSHCVKCHKIQPMSVKPQIYNFNKLILLHLIQNPTQYYELQWDPLTHIHGLPIKEHKTQNISINCYITAKREKETTKYGTHWRQKSRDKTWNTLKNNKFSQTEQSVESKHACIFIASRFDCEN